MCFRLSPLHNPVRLIQVQRHDAHVSVDWHQDWCGSGGLIEAVSCAPCPHRLLLVTQLCYCAAFRSFIFLPCLTWQHKTGQLIWSYMQKRKPRAPCAVGYHFTIAHRGTVTESSQDQRSTATNPTNSIVRHTACPGRQCPINQHTVHRHYILGIHPISQVLLERASTTCIIVDIQARDRLVSSG